MIEVFHKEEPLRNRALSLASDEFRAFALSDDVTTLRQNGLLKIIDDRASCLCEGKICFLDDMGDA